MANGKTALSRIQLVVSADVAERLSYYVPVEEQNELIVELLTAYLDQIEAEEAAAARREARRAQLRQGVSSVHSWAQAVVQALLPGNRTGDPKGSIRR